MSPHRLPPLAVLKARLDTYAPRDLPTWLGPLLRAATTSAAVVAPLFQVGSDWRLLLVEKSAHLQRHAGDVAFPGGREDPEDGGLWPAASREFEEETGLPRTQLQRIGELSLVPTLTGYRVQPYVAILEPAPPSELPPGSGEVARVFTVSVTDFMDPNAVDLRLPLWRGRPYPDWRHHPSGTRIWGATAIMIAELIQVWTDIDLLEALDSG